MDGSQRSFIDDTEVNSQPSIENTNNKSKNKKNRIKRTAGFIPHNHWLFQKFENVVEIKHARESNQHQKITVKELEDEDNFYMDQLESFQDTLTPSSWSACISVDHSVFTTDTIDYLFKGDTMRFNKKYSLTKQEKKDCNLNKTGFASNTSNDLYSAYTSSRFPRRAKMKPTSSAVTIDSDDEFLPDVHMHTSKTSETNDRQIKLIDALPFKKRVEKKLSRTVIDDTDSESESQPKKKRKSENNNNNNNNGGFVQTVKSSLSKFFDSKAGKKSTSNPNEDVKVIKVDSQMKEATRTTTAGYSTKHIASGTTRGATEKQEERVECPMCNQMFNQSDINDHAFTCQGPVLTRNRKQNSQPTSPVDQDFDDPIWNGKCAKENIVDTNIKTNSQDEEEMRNSSKADVWKHDTSSHTKVNNRNKTLTLRNATQNAKIGVKEIDILKPMSLPNKRLGNKFGRKHNNNVKKLTADEVASALMSDDEDTTVVSKQNNKNKTVWPTTERPTFVSDDEDNNDAENSMMQQYLPKAVNNTRKHVISKATHLRDFNNSQNSQDDGYEKCFRCDQRFCTTDGTYNKHSKQCLEKTNLETTIG